MPVIGLVDKAHFKIQTKMKLLGILFLLCVLTMPVVAQDHCRIMFYNVENLFDTADDPSTADDEFTPRGKKHWTKAKYTDKLLKIAEVIDSVGDKELPCIVGLAEVENRWVLEDLTQKTALADGNYGIVHQDSPDRRGIDVALLYRKDCFELLEADFLRLSFPEDTTIRTRDILYASGVLYAGEVNLDDAVVVRDRAGRELLVFLGAENGQLRRYGIKSIHYWLFSPAPVL